MGVVEESRPFEAGVVLAPRLLLCLVHPVALEGLNGCSSWTIHASGSVSFRRGRKSRAFGEILWAPVLLWFIESEAKDACFWFLHLLSLL
jgi:hypothetical protein